MSSSPSTPSPSKPPISTPLFILLSTALLSPSFFSPPTSSRLPLLTSYLSSSLLFHLSTRNPHPEVSRTPDHTLPFLDRIFLAIELLPTLQILHYIFTILYGISLLVVSEESTKLLLPQTSALKILLFNIPIITGSLLRLLSYHSLGKNYTYTLHPPSTLTTTGPYTYLRHPGYTGAILLIATTAYTSEVLQVVGGYKSSVWEWGRWVGVGMVGGLVGSWAVGRGRVEDEVLRERFGRVWREWRGRTWGVVPGF